MADTQPSKLDLKDKQGLTGDFLKDIAGHHVKSDNLGAAQYWTDTTGAPMPDRTIGWLKFLTVIGGGLGLDHMYLRSPVTGFLKLITLGGFGIWYMWDILQVYLEKDRVVRYGLSAPFDINIKSLMGVGQGMITDQSTGYKSTASFLLFMAATILGAFGIDNFLAGQPGIGLRRAVDTAFFAMWTYSGNATQSTVGRAILYFFALFVGFFVFVPYLANLIGLMTGYTDGVSYFNMGSTLNWFMNVYDEPFKDDDKAVHSDVSIKLREMFGFKDRDRNEVLKPFQLYDQAPTKEKVEQKMGPWIPAVAIANPLGALLFSIFNTIPGFNKFLQAKVRSSIKEIPLPVAVAEEVAHETKGVAAAAKVMAGAAGLDDVINQAKAVTGAVSQAQAQIASTKASALSAVGGLQSRAAALREATAGHYAAAKKVADAVSNILQNKDSQSAGQKVQEIVNDFHRNHGPQNTQGTGLDTLMDQAEQLIKTNPLEALTMLLPYLQSQAGQKSQTGGGSAPLSNEAKILGATLGALIVGGGIKGLIDFFVTD
jgi:hypothetical protein